MARLCRSPEIATMKARRVALLRVPTKFLEDVTKERTATLLFPGRLPVQGGVPILYEGECVGGVGVSGVKSPQDDNSNTNERKAQPLCSETRGLTGTAGADQRLQGRQGRRPVPRRSRRQGGRQTTPSSSAHRSKTTARTGASGSKASCPAAAISCFSAAPPATARARTSSKDSSRSLDPSTSSSTRPPST